MLAKVLVVVVVLAMVYAERERVSDGKIGSGVVGGSWFGKPVGSYKPIDKDGKVGPTGRSLVYGAVPSTVGLGGMPYMVDYARMGISGSVPVYNPYGYYGGYYGGGRYYY